jgi:hypothetical protein
LVLLIYETAIPVFQKQDIFLKKFWWQLGAVT